MTESAVSMRSDDRVLGGRVLVACADTAYGSLVERQLELDGYEVERCHDVKGILRVAGRHELDVGVIDVDLMADADVELITFVRRQNPGAQLVLLFDVEDLERALDGIRRGAFFYLPKTSPPADVALVVGKAVRALQTEQTAQQFERSLLEEMVGGSASMRRVIEVLTKVSPTDSTVLLLGESGTGKELLSNAVHRLSPRADRPFIAVNCAALPEALLESELFGHIKGAFTGADADKPGLFEEADGGTLFLDEVGDMALATQAKLLRVLQNGEIRRVGSGEISRVDVRIIAATNQNLEEAVAGRAFREDLYFRLNVVTIRIPPLRDRMDALPKLISYFLNRFSTRFSKPVRSLDPQAEALLGNYPYPGNVRELESIVAHAVIMSDSDVITARDLPDQVRFGTSAHLALPNYADDSIPSLREMEERLIRGSLERLEGNQTEVAKRLGVSRSTLWRKMKDYGIPAKGAD
jgi:DNA-binding NtrC family response regulator